MPAHLRIDGGSLAEQGAGRRVVVTGASGNIGTCLLDVLEADPRATSVVAVARRPPRVEHRPKVSWVAADIGVDDLAPILDGAHVVVNLAWRIQPSWDVAAQRRTNVDGAGRVFRAATTEGADIVHASSVGAYSAGPKDHLVDESWPLGGHQGHPYSLQKAEVEGLLDEVERAHPATRVVRLRPALVFQAPAGQELRRSGFACAQGASRISSCHRLASRSLFAVHPFGARWRVQHGPSG